ncbi:hypothetical protein [Paramicrobacterium fandaimingii]|uniref:hypothetical protein n=1 Tax=Paramicrobacterium fandaimingii TaxID=2708079 RepID=UPI00141DF4F1|nr:hypothetical protein [Microbacterium fandaimingii]
MRTSEFYVRTEAKPDSFGWGTDFLKLDETRLTGLMSARDPNHSDLEIAIALARLAHEEFEAYGTNGETSIDEEQSRIVLRALQAVIKRLGILTFNLPFRDFGTFYKHWRAEDATGSWQARRDILDEHFEPLHEQLDERESEALESSLAEAISPRKAVGWPGVDEEIFEMRRHFDSAVTEQDYSNVGNDAVAVLEALSRAVYKHSEHGEPGKPEPQISNTKDRLTRFVESAVVGSDGAAIRKLVRAAIELAQETKHRRTGDRRSAGVTADSVILLANILRRIDPSQS